MADQKLVEYVKGQLKKGQTVEMVRQALLTQGWKEKDIAEAIASAAAVPIPAGPSMPQKKRRWPMIVAVVGAILIIVALIGILFPGLLF